MQAKKVFVIRLRDNYAWINWPAHMLVSRLTQATVFDSRDEAEELIDLLRWREMGAYVVSTKQRADT